jgi:hypothetical protein
VAIAHLEGIDCRGCLVAKRQEQIARRGPTVGRASDWPNRLPAGSEKLIRWTGKAWIGTLKVPGDPGFEATHEAPTERECCHGLHRLYVEWFDREATPAAAEVEIGSERVIRLSQPGGPIPAGGNDASRPTKAARVEDCQR